MLSPCSHPGCSGNAFAWHSDHGTSCRLQGLLQRALGSKDFVMQDSTATSQHAGLWLSSGQCTSLGRCSTPTPCRKPESVHASSAWTAGWHALTAREQSTWLGAHTVQKVPPSMAGPQRKLKVQSLVGIYADTSALSCRQRSTTFSACL